MVPTKNNKTLKELKSENKKLRKQAEQQAAKLEIEASLERVRSASMAMHHSEELMDVSSVVYEELRKLGITQFTSAGFHIVDEEKQEQTVFNFTIDLKQLPRFTMPLSGDPVLDARYKAWKKQQPIFYQKVEGDKLEAHLEFLHPAESATAEELASKEDIPDPVHFHFANFYKGYLHILATEKLKENQKAILVRFAKVFEQTYTRFLDLQKAEAQAREAQIEVALERVRSRSMAMHNSSELQEVVDVVRNQLIELGIEMDATQIQLLEESKDNIVVWVANASNPYGRKLSIEPLGHQMILDFISARAEGKKEFLGTYSLTQKNSYYKEAFKKTDLKYIPDERKKTMLAGSGLCIYAAFAQKTGLHLLNFTGTLYTKEERSVVKRFSEVFDQAYIRFEDLQKAEAQAREAQIEVALERVRSRSMAMHKSEELLEVGELLYRELSKLGITSMTSGFTLMDIDKKIDWSYVVSPSDGSITQDPQGIPRDETNVMRSLTASWEKQEPYHLVELNEKETIAHQTYIAENSINFAFTAEELISVTPERLNLQTFNFKQGYLLLVGADKLSKDKVDITIRFAKVFEQTYTRFLDLQQAEKQAREAQIEAALERIRSRSMAMQSSDELSEVVRVMYNEVEKLEISNWGCALMIFNDKNKNIQLWFSEIVNKKHAKPYDFENIEHKIVREWWDFWESEEQHLRIHLKDEEKHEFGRYMFENSGMKELPEEVKEVIMNQNEVYLEYVKMKHGMVEFIDIVPFPEDSLPVLQRITRTFEQAYTRFLDVKRAEAQAREAQIEVALERIRSRTMGMQKSKELQETAILLFQQLKELGVNAFATGFVILDKNKKDGEYWMSAEGDIQPPHYIPNEEDPVTRNLYIHWEKAEKLYVENVGGKKLKAHYQYLRSLPQTGFQAVHDAGIEFPEWQRMHAAYFSHGFILIITKEKYKEKNIFIRFAKVFEQTYIRFLDLQKAEAQAREAQIEAALERVRSRSMGMQQSDDLNQVLSTMFHELRELKFELERCVIWIFNEEDKSFRWYSANPEAEIETYHVPFYDYQVITDYWEAWEKRIPQMYYDLSGDLKKGMDEYLFNHTEMANMPDEVIEGMTAPEQLHIYNTFNDFGALFVPTIEPQEEEIYSILERFGNAFNQAYTRFHDLQKAENQAREAQIEAALERIRSRSMAMQSSDELSEVVRVMYDEVEKLKVSNWGCLLMIFDEENQNIRTWFSEIVNKQHAKAYDFDNLNHKIVREWWEFWESENELLSIHLKDDEKLDFDTYLFEDTGFKDLPEEVKEVIMNENKVYLEYVNMKHGIVEFIDIEPFPEETIPILQRITRTFEQAYTRFLDVQRAEEQAREAQIEAALERVRSRSMGMQISAELHNVNMEVRNQVEGLGIELFAFGIHICHENEPVSEAWMGDPIEGQMPQVTYDHSEDPLSVKMYKGWKEKQTLRVETIQGKKLKVHFEYMMTLVPDRSIFEKMTPPKKLMYHIAYFTYGFFIFVTTEPRENDHDIFRRFAQVFEQTYTRFLDLKKAEKQAREAQIEAALERVRARTMAMQSSDELLPTSTFLLKELRSLGQTDLKGLFGVSLIDEEKKQFISYISDSGGPVITDQMILPIDDHWLIRDLYDAWKKARENKKAPQFLSRTLSNTQMKEWIGKLKEYNQGSHPNAVVDDEILKIGKDVLELPNWTFDDAFYRQGMLFYQNVKPLSDEFRRILIRFAKVFEQTYTRFQDIKRAEKLALETARQSSLDRIRAEIASMRSAEDLNQITPIIWDELKTLDIPFIRCGVFIIDEENGISHTYLSTSQGDPIAALHIPIEGISLVENAVASWKKKKIYTEHWDKQDFREWTQNLIDRGFIKSKKKYEAGSAPETLDLHFLPFKHGMLYIGNTESLPQEKLDLGQSMADAFSVAYDRYEDFNKIEHAKQKIEEAFRELEAAKDQLVQQEKLASLGQLTAGIAHEIKNPLNFVNNFSDLSIELVEEAREELSAHSSQLSEGTKNSLRQPAESAEAERRRGVSDEATNHALILELLDDIESNLKTIHKHGTRADGIVKSMLQHSRGGSGKMEPTDVNALIKEYANLAFHGMRAGKDPINVDIELDLDENVGEVEMIGEDFSRVILNLCNNAFDAMREKLSAVSSQQSADSPFEGGSGDDSSNEYEPKLTVRTHQTGNNVTIEIQDNGPGIPDEIKEKVLQPFFTTKKGTAGTGLGLSITNDIIKAHGGALDIQSDQDGSIFSITLNT